MAGSLVAHDLELEEAISRFAPHESAPNRLEPSKPSSGKPSANGDRTVVELDADRVTVVSAPGKVLMAGGYLVLDRENEGLVVATSARFYCCVTDLPLDTASSGSDMAAQLVVRAGQFPSDASTWSYTVSLSKGDGASSPSLSLEPADKETSADRNKFVEITLSVVLHYAWEALRGEDHSNAGSATAAEQLIKLLKGTTVGQLVAVFADNDFYSQREQVSKSVHVCRSFTDSSAVSAVLAHALQLFGQIIGVPAPSSCYSPNKQDRSWVIRLACHFACIRSVDPSIAHPAAILRFPTSAPNFRYWRANPAFADCFARHRSLARPACALHSPGQSRIRLRCLFGSVRHTHLPPVLTIGPHPAAPAANQPADSHIRIFALGQSGGGQVGPRNDDVVPPTKGASTASG